jgi:hypothetical protein
MWSIYTTFVQFMSIVYLIVHNFNEIIIFSNF